MLLLQACVHLSRLYWQVFRVPPRWLFVRVETTDGIVGWGEGTLEGHTETVEGAFDALRDQFMGWDADKIQDIWQHAYRSKFYRGGPVLMVHFYTQMSWYAMTDSLSSPRYQVSTLRYGTSRAKS